VFRRASIPLPLAGFGLELLDAQAERCGLSVAAFMERAAGRYVSDPERYRPSWNVPRFLTESAQRAGSRTVDVELDPELWDSLEREASSQGVPVELIVAHAAMLLAADLDV
jgi:hypothetical protein